MCHIFADEPNAAEKRIEEMRRIGHPARANYLEAIALARVGDERAFAKLDAFAPPNPTYLGLVRQLLGDPEGACDAWTQPMRERHNQLSQLRILTDAFLDPAFIASEQFQKVLAIGGLHDGWKQELLKRAAQLTDVTGVAVED